ncbi:Putative uncharacterized protein OS=Candidatus Kuenenia stuttgartiensis GN=kustb0147 PE=4 SV=1 [Gemmataceae bacterium]|nr:Putative uncharacterized protein OS=Candidatus Kuenenia stuttgartiensis GN=kustb0147 PE=4 SV=1 [Gemmataceae bacterium]VTT97910.1 Putative uncharacterized protein OS=Candidatus Kuenenia stuttgartiensis GN=kustb0147 PE=4 SV=1 [Gemmataceae bacterium]
MTSRSAALAAAAALALAGCCLFERRAQKRAPQPAPPTFSQYHLDGWDWGAVNRVLVLPFLNESENTRAGDETRVAFTSELQKLGRFEVVAAPPDDTAALAATVHRGGRFDEAVMLKLARLTRADVIVHGTVTQYSPYNTRPRLGLVLQAVSPEQAKVVASVDGLWDATDAAVAERARAHYRQRPRERPPWVRNHVIVSEDSFASELVLESPALFQRFVCGEAALTLLGLPVPWVASGAAVVPAAGSSGPGCATQAGPPVPPAAGPPPGPPAAR